MDQEPSQISNQDASRQHRPALIAAAAVVVFIVLVVGVVFAFNKGDQKPVVKDDKSTGAVAAIASGSDVQDNLDKASSALKQAKADQSAARAAIANSNSQVKVGN